MLITIAVAINEACTYHSEKYPEKYSTNKNQAYGLISFLVGSSTMPSF